MEMGANPYKRVLTVFTSLITLVEKSKAHKTGFGYIFDIPN